MLYVTRTLGYMIQQIKVGSSETSAVSSEPRVIVIQKGNCGFGFTLRGPVKKGGELQKINGELYPPLQFISAVREGGAADKAGMKKGDMVLEVNGQNVAGSTNAEVAELVKTGGDELTLLVLSAIPEVPKENYTKAEERDEGNKSTTMPNENDTEAEVRDEENMTTTFRQSPQEMSVIRRRPVPRN